MTHPIVRPTVVELSRNRMAVSNAQNRGVRSATTVHAAALVAKTGMTYLGLLTEEEQRLAKTHPAGAARCAVVMDHFTAVICAAVAEVIQ